MIEVDGGYHQTVEQKQYDDVRTQVLNLHGFEVIRFTNEEVLNETVKVLEKIHRHLSHLPTLPDGFESAGGPPFGPASRSDNEGLGQGAGLASSFPADYIAEGVDQTRGWFFTLHAIATLVFDCVAFKNVISNGLVLDKNGNKMSKRLGNTVDSFETLQKYGADAVRWYMIENAPHGTILNLTLMA